MKTTIGGDRLGSGNKQEVSIKNYNRSTHDLGYIWRSSMASGTLVPFMHEVALPGDRHDINLHAEVLTLPTKGPLYGRYKVQFDVFSCPIRLYNGKLHMNKLGIGMDMAQIKLPQLKVKAAAAGGLEPIEDNEQINASSVLSYLGIRGVGYSQTPREIEREFNAIGYLGMWDIYKQYYANKQETNGWVIHSGTGSETPWNMEVAQYQHNEGGTVYDLLDTEQTVTMGSTGILTIEVGNGGGIPDWSQVILRDVTGDTDYVAMEVYENVTFESDSDGTERMILTTYIGTVSGANTWQVQGEAIDGIVAPNLDGKPKLVQFPLENIDQMREDILTQTSSPNALVIDENSIAPYNLPLTKRGTVYSCQSNQEGLPIKTYQSDLFNNWITTEWIDGDNGINAITAVDTSAGNFTIDALNLAQKVYNMLNRIAISGGTYDDWLNAVYTHERARSVESPVYQGSLIKELGFQEVVAQSSGVNIQEAGEVASGNILGELAGRGVLGGKNKGGKIRIKTDEPSIILGIASITPLIDYSQGNKFDTNLKTMNDFHKPALDAIGYQDLITDQMAWFDTEIAPDGQVKFNSAGKQPAWINYMTNVNQVRGNFAEKNDSMYMVLNRRYESEGTNGIKDLTTYVDPSKFNHIFADTRLDAQNFWTQIKVDITARRKMSAKVIPNL